MDASKIFTVLCAFLLVICLTLSITALVVMRHAVDELAAWQEGVSIPVGNPDPLPTDTEEESLPSDTPDGKETTEADVLYNRFYLRAVEGGIGVYTEEGYLIRHLAVAIETLPLQEQNALREGIRVSSWRELLERIQDYE